MLKERLVIENVEIESAHRAGRKSRNEPRTVVWKLSWFEYNQNISRKVKLPKGDDIFIKREYCKDTVEYRIKL